MQQKGGMSRFCNDTAATAIYTLLIVGKVSVIATETVSFRVLPSATALAGSGPFPAIQSAGRQWHPNLKFPPPAMFAV